MFKISRLTDYGVVLLCHLAQNQKKGTPSSARDLALASGLPLPTVSKLLKILARRKVIVAHRGTLGGYEFMQNPHEVSVLSLIEAFEGKPATTACMSESSDICAIDSSCVHKGGWLLVHRKIARLLSQISLAELMAEKPQRGASS